MKYWMGLPGMVKDGQCGTCDDTGFVPDSVECSKSEYEDYINSMPVIVCEKTDIEKLVEHAKKRKCVL